jgi:hypothetical protein
MLAIMVVIISNYRKHPAHGGQIASLSHTTVCTVGGAAARLLIGGGYVVCFFVCCFVLRLYMDFDKYLTFGPFYDITQ